MRKSNKIKYNYTLMSIIFLGLITFFSCKSDDNDSLNNMFFNSVQLKYSMGSAQVMEIDILTDKDWKITMESSLEGDDLSWVHPSKTSGSGTYRLKILMDENDCDERTLTVHIITDIDDKVYTATQSGGSRVVSIAKLRDTLNLINSYRSNQGEKIIANLNNWFIKTIIVGTKSNYKKGYVVVMDNNIENSGLTVKIDDNVDLNIGDSVYIPIRGAVFKDDGVLTMVMSDKYKSLINIDSNNNTVTPINVSDFSFIGKYESMLVKIDKKIQATDLNQIGKPLSDLIGQSLNCSIVDDSSISLPLTVYSLNEFDNSILPSSSADFVEGIVFCDAGKDKKMAIVPREKFFVQDMSKERSVQSTDPMTPIISHIGISNVLMQGVDLGQTQTKLQIYYVFGDGNDHIINISTNGDNQGLVLPTQVTANFKKGCSGVVTINMDGEIVTDTQNPKIEFDVSSLGLESHFCSKNIDVIKPITIDKIYFAGNLLEKNSKIRNGKIRIYYSNSYGRYVKISGSVSGEASQGISFANSSDSLCLKNSSGYVDYVLSGTPVIEGNVSFDIDIKALSNGGIILPKDNEELKCSASVESFSLAQWNFSTPNIYVLGGETKTDHFGTIIFPYYTTTEGFDNGKGSDQSNLVDKENGYCKSGEPARIELVNCNNQANAGFKMNFTNKMIVHAEKLESKIKFIIPVMDFKKGVVHMNTSLSLTNPAPKKWGFAYIDNNTGREVNVSWEKDNVEINTKSAPCIIDVDFPIPYDLEKGELTFIMKPMSLVAANKNNMTFLNNSVNFSFVPKEIK